MYSCNCIGSIGPLELVSRGVPRAILLAVLWWVLTDGEPGSWVVGVPTVVIATLVSLALPATGRWRLRLAGAPQFLLFFLWESIWAGIDVACRALHSRLPLNPGLMEYALRIPEGPACIFFVNAISLLPGTLTARLNKGRLIVHVLDTTAEIQTRLRALESRVAALFAIDLLHEPGGRQ
jgi:multicomponent Na+:H+ antiporter subunit E